MRRTRRGSCGGQRTRQDPSPRIGFLSEELFGPRSICHRGRLFRFTPEHFFLEVRPLGEAPDPTAEAPDSTAEAPDPTTEAPEATSKAPGTTSKAPETTPKAPENASEGA